MFFVCFYSRFLPWNVNFKTLFNKAPISVSDIDEIKHSRTLLWAVGENDNDISDQIEESFSKNMPVYQPVCPNINQSESIRLDNELRRWINGESDRNNWTTSTKPKFLLSSSSPLEGKTKRKLYLSQDKKVKTMQKMIDVPTATTNAVQVFSPILREHASLFEALGRKDDTFYVVWFTGKHLLLPASRTNDTVRPKMSLVLPAVSIKGNIICTIAFDERY